MERFSRPTCWMGPMAVLLGLLAALLAPASVAAQGATAIKTISIPLAPDPDIKPPKGSGHCPPVLQVISKAKTTFSFVIAGTATVDVEDIDDSTCLLTAVPNVKDAPFAKPIRASSARKGDFANAAVTWPATPAQAKCKVCGGCDITTQGSGCFTARKPNDKFPDLRLTFDARAVSAQFNIVNNTCGPSAVLKLSCGTNTEAEVGTKVYVGYIAPQLNYPKPTAKTDTNPRASTSPLIVCEEDAAFLTCPPNQVIAVVAATYGRFNKDECPTALIPAGSPELEVPVEGCSTELTAAVAKACNGAKTCGLKRTTKLDDPCPQDDGIVISKYFQINFRCAAPNSNVSGTRIQPTTAPNAGFTLSNATLIANGTTNGTTPMAVNSTMPLNGTTPLNMTIVGMGNNTAMGNMTANMTTTSNSTRP